jgi:hypothetical protein
MMGGEGVTFGTDAGGFAPMSAPRFGADACPGARGDEERMAGGRVRSQALAQKNAVRYSSPLTTVGDWRFEASSNPKDAAYTKDEVKAWLAVARVKTGQASSSSLGKGSQVVLERWQAMEESNSNTPLERVRAGSREWDINVDGMAHYGMIPDFLQDLANVLRASPAGDAPLASVLTSAERYLRMWSTIESRAAAMGPAI